jgi:16S rRNA (cytidine1402-2'-O)-methyltransferase
LPETVFAAYESPERLHKTLELVSETLPESNICIAREMTKKFEEIVRGKASKLFQREYKGEITILLE